MIGTTDPAPFDDPVERFDEIVGSGVAVEAWPAPG